MIDFRYGCKRKAKRNPTNWMFLSTAKCQKMTANKLPKFVSLREQFPKPYKQIYGNCTSNAVCAIDAYFNHNGSDWVPSTTFCYHQQRLLDHADMEIDDGSYIETALDVCRKYGVCNSKVWKNEMSWQAKPSKEAYADGLKGKEVTKYYNVTTELQIKKALASGYPVAACLYWVTGKYNPKTFIISRVTKKEANNCEQGHAIVITGYDDYKGVFEIRNSWGNSWGDGGYCYITYGSFKNMIDWSDSYAVKG